MPNVTANGTIENDVNFTLVQLGSNQQQESAALNYSRGLTNGDGSLQINYGVITSGTLPSGGKQYFDLRALTKSVFGTTSSIQFSKIKSILVENNETAFGMDINVYATGGNAFTEMFNGGSGNLLVKPYAVHQYSDPDSGATADASNKDLTIEDVSGTGAKWTFMVVGITG